MEQAGSCLCAGRGEGELPASFPPGFLCFPLRPLLPMWVLPSRYEALFPAEGADAARSISAAQAASRGEPCRRAGSARPRWPPSPARRCSALSPTAQGPGRGGEIRFHGHQPFYFINCSAKPDSFAGALHSFYPSSLSIGVGVAVLLFWGSVTLSKTFWRFLPSSGEM